jgi:glycosyltransferase involved in cell wall biosynthesis
MNHSDHKKIRVAHVITRMIVGGAQENTRLSVLGFQEKGGFTVDLVTGTETGPEGRLDLAAIRSVLFEPALVRNVHPVKDLVCLVRLTRLFKRRRYDIVHTHSSKAGILGRLAARIAGVPVILHTIHGLPFHPYQGRFQNTLFVLLEKYAARVTRIILVVADAMKRKALQRGIGEPGQYRTIYSGMRLDAFTEARTLRESARADFGIERDRIVIGTIARLFPLKGHRYLLDIAGELAEAEPRIHFLWIGDGILRERFTRRIRSLGLENRFHLGGLVSPGRIPRCLAAMDIVVHPSLREGLARVLPQSLAAGIPAVSFDVDGAHEVIEDGVTGFLVPPKDTVSLKRKILELARDPDRHRRFSRAGRERVDPLFRHDTMIRKLEMLYRELL